jgi:hypothetical protein
MERADLGLGRHRRVMPVLPVTWLTGTRVPAVHKHGDRFCPRTTASITVYLYRFLRLQ